MLKDIIATDVSDVFLDFEEFADFHIFSNAERSNQVSCLIVKEGNISKEVLARINERYDGFYGDIVTIHARTNDLPEVPVQDQKVRFDDSLYNVELSEEDMGMTTLTLVAVRA